MEAKKSKSQQQQQQQPRAEAAPESLKNFVGEIKGEVRKITWTDKEELKAYTKIVVGATFVLGLGIFAVDLFIKTCLDSLSHLVRYFIG
jgi:preprotein translocase subunit SecE